MTTSADRLALVASLALLLGCGGGGVRTTDWDRPARSTRPTLEAEVVAWPPAAPLAARELQVRTVPGPVVAAAGELAVPTGWGLRVIPLAGERPARAVATPGWAQRVVDAGDGRWWVADGFRGIALVEDRGDELAVVGSWTGDGAVGEVVDLQRAGPHTLALSADGWLLVLQPSDAGEPREVGRLLLDGKPWNLDVWAQGDGWRWVVSAQEGGVIRGDLSAAGEPSAGLPEVPRSYAYAAAGSPELVVASRPTGAVVTRPARDDLGAHPAHAYGVWIDATGEPWFACGTAGLFRGLPAREDAQTPIRYRAGAGARAVTPGPDGAGVLVSWADGVIEQVDDDGLVLASWDLGPSQALRGIHGEWLVTSEAAQGVSRITHLAGGEGWVTPAPVTGLGGPAERPLVALGEGGLVRLTGGAGDPAPSSQTTGGVIVDADVDGAGRTWIVTNSGLLSRLAPDGETERSWTVTPEWEAMGVAASDRWVVATERHNGDVLARPLADDEAPSIRAWLPGKGHDVEIIGDVAVVGVTWFGVAAVPLGEDATPPVASLPLPRPRLTRNPEVELCRTPAGVLATLGELGLADIRLQPDGSLRLARIIETPGRAVDCSPGSAPDTYLVADWSGLIELTVPMDTVPPR